MKVTRQPDEDQEPPLDQAVVAAYQTVAARRSNFDSMMWQVPSLAMTAQAFLLTIALGSSIATTSRVISSLLGLTLSLMSIQLMAKHRFLEVVDSRLAESLERYMRLDVIIGYEPHGPLGARAGKPKSQLSVWIRLSSYRLWLLGLVLFAIADVVAAVLAVAEPQVLSARGA